MKKAIFILPLFIIMLMVIGCTKEKLKNKLIFSDEKSSNYFAEIYEFDDGSKIYSEFANIELQQTDKEKINLSVALEQKLITIDDIISKMTYKSDANDGGSKLYSFNANDNELSDEDFTLIKCNTLKGNRNIIIGATEKIIEKCNE